MTLGLKDLYYAVCTEADGAESYGTPKKMAEAMSADLSVKTADGSLYADDTLSESVTEFASGTLKLGIKDLTPEVLAELLGQAVDKNSVVWAGKEDEPPYVAVGFRAKKTGGKYRYVWLLKAKFKVPSEKYETKGESIKFNTPDIEASFTTRKKDTCGKQTLWEQRKAQRLKRGLQQCRKRQQQWKVYKTGKERGVAWAAP